MDRSLEAVFLDLARAEEAITRLDERLRACAFAGGWAARLDFIEAVAWGWNSGDIVSMEDLVLHDHDMDRRLPERALWSTFALVRARRKAIVAGPELLSGDGVAWLAGARKSPPAASVNDWGPTSIDPADIDRPDVATRLAERLRRLTQGVSEGPGEAIAEWLTFLRLREADTPILLHAAAALEAWSLIDPLPARRWSGPILVARWLSDRGRVASHLLGLEMGIRAHARTRRDFSSAPMIRLAYWLKVMQGAATQGVEELQRLELARQVLARRLEGLRADARLKDLVALLLEQPMVTAPMIAKSLQISQTAARRLIEALGAGVSEISGRSRFRAWRV
jgi:hypothetical protein